MFEFEFMRRMLLVGFLLAIMMPMVGIVLVNRKTSMLGDALSHVSLTGVGLGLILGFNPVWGAAVTCVLAALAIEVIRKKLPEYGDLATAVIMSAGLGIAAVLSDFAPGGNSFESYLFGSIVAVSKKDVIYVAVAFVLIVLFCALRYGSLLDIAIDGNLARLAGVQVTQNNIIFTILSAVTVALATKVVGALLVTSTMILPVAAALMVCRSYKSCFFTSIGLGVFNMLVGLTISYHVDIRPGGSIVILAILGLLACFLIKKRKDRRILHA